MTTKTPPVSDDDFVRLPDDHQLRKDIDFVGVSHPAHPVCILAGMDVGSTAYKKAWCKRKDYPKPTRTVTFRECIVRRSDGVSLQWLEDPLTLVKNNRDVFSVECTGRQERRNPPR